MARKLKVLLLVHPYFRPDRKGPAVSGSERDVWSGIRRLGYDCRISAVQDSIEELEGDLAEFRPDVVFNLLEEFRDEGVFDFHLISYLEAKGIAYTGCNPKGMIVSRNKFWVAQLSSQTSVSSPRTWLAAEALRSRELPFPLFVKFNCEHASLGLTKKNLVRTPQALKSRVRQMQLAHPAEVLVQEFIPGREFSVSVWGNRRPEVLAVRELYLGSAMSFATERIKFSKRQQRKNWILARKFAGGVKLGKTMKSAASLMFRRLQLSGYARFDFRVSEDDKPFLIDVNANPNLARNEDFASAANECGVKYEDVLMQIIRLGREYRPVI